MEGRSTRYGWAIAVAIAWIGVAVGMFLYLFDRRDTDDFAGWIFAYVVAGIPAFAAIATAPLGRPMRAGRAAAIGLPAGVMVGWSAFFLTAWVTGRFFRLGPDAVPLLIAFGAGVVGLSVGGFGLCRILMRRAHPAGARVVLAIVSAGAVAMLLVFGSWGVRDPGWLLVFGGPAIWVAPMWLVTTTGPRPPDPLPAAIARER